MRKFGLCITGCALFFMASVALVEGQQGGKKGGKGGFGGFGGRGFGNDPFSLLQREEVKKELDVSEEQLTKLPDEMMNAISHVLNDKQFSRFKQINLQKKGNTAFKDKSVQKNLKLTSDQAKSIDSILEDETKELGELRGTFGGGKKGGGGKGAVEKMDKIRTDAKEKIYTVLTKDQRKMWREMIGAEFKFATFNFGGGFGGKKGKKKADQ